MTKKRRRVFGAVAVLTALTLTYAGWKIYASRPLLQRLVVEKIETTLGGELHYREFRPTFSGVDIADVYFTRGAASKMRWALHAQQISVRVNYVALLRDLFEPAPRVIRISVIQPTLTLSPARATKSLPSRLPARSSPATPPAETAKPGAPSAEENTASKYVIIENVEIQRGEIVWQDSASGLPDLTVVNELSGWLQALGESHAQVRLHGKVRHPSEAELTLSTAVDLQHIALDSVQLDISDLQFTGKLPLAVPGRLEMAGGKLGGSLVLSRSTLPSAPDEIRVGGHLHLRDGKFLYAFTGPSNGSGKTKRSPSWADRLAQKFFALSGSTFFDRVATSLQNAPLQIENASFDATLEDGQLVIANGRQLVNNQPMHLNGSVQLGELPFWVSLPERGQKAYAVKIAANSLDGDSLDALVEVPVRAPAVDLHFVCDSLSLREFFAPFHRVSEQSKVSAAKVAPPVSGIAAIRADFTGSFFSPRIQATLTSPHAVIHKKRVRQLEAQFSYGQPLADSSAAHDSETALHWRGRGMIDFDYGPAAQNAASAPGFNWEGWGQVDLAAKNLPQSATVVVDGNLTPLLSRLLARRGFKLETQGQKESEVPFSFLSSLPETRLAGLAQISGSVWQPIVHGRMNLDVKRPQQTATRWLGNFSLVDDTLHLKASLPNQASKVNATIWRLGKRPLFKIEGLEVELLPVIFGEKISRTLLADLDMNFSLIGHTDSLNINIDARKKAAPTKLFHLVGYMLPLLQGDRVTSGYVKFFPDQPNAFAANYTLHVQDSLFKISDFRSEPWLNAALEVKTGRSREIKGGMRLAGADLARLLTGATNDSAIYRGKLFGELNIAGTLHDPQAAGNFWLFDGFFHGLGNFALSGKMRADRSGWKVDSLAVTKDKQPYLTAGLGYRRSDRRMHMNVHGADLRGGELLHALFNFPEDKFDGTTTLDLRAEGPAKDFWNEKGLPLSGTLAVTEAQVWGVHFDEVTADLAAGSRSAKQAMLSSRGLYLPRVRAIKQDAFSLTGDVFLPINRTSAVAASISGAGNFLAVLPEMSSWFKTTSSYGQLSLNLSGPYERLTIFNSHLKINDGAVTMTRLARDVTHIEAEISVDGRGTFVEIPRFTARFDDATVTLRNVESLPSLLLADAGNNAGSTFTNTIDAAWQPLRLGNSPLHLGTLLLKSDDMGLPLSIPGLMKKHETGRFRLTGLIDSTARRGDADEFIIAGPWSHPVVQGRAVLENVEFQFPFDEESDPGLRHLLRNINWNVVAESRKDNHYVLTQTTAFNDVYVNLGIDDAASRLRFSGIVSDTTFSDEAFFIEGKVVSTRGEVEYLDMNFEVEEFGAEFDKSQLFPQVYGRAKTVVRDSTNTPYNVYLTLVAVDPTSGREELRGRFQHAIFKLTSDQPNFWGTGQEQVLASLGYSVDNIGKSATEAVGIGTDNLLMRPFLRPVERAVQRTFGLDIVRFSSRFTRNFLTTNFNNNAADNAAAAPEAHRSLFRSSRVTVGKYLLNNLYLSYIGQLESGLERDSTNHVAGQPLPDSEYKLQLRHRLGLEYRLNSDMLLQVEYDFADESVRADRKIWLRHSFPVEFPKETN